MSVVDKAKGAAEGLMQGLMAKVVALAPDSWMPGGVPDPLIRFQHGHVGRPLSRLDGVKKVSGAAPFAAEFPMDGMVYAALVCSTIAKGRIVELDTTAAEAAEGFVGVMTHRNAPRLSPPPPVGMSAKGGAMDNLPVMQDDRIHWNGEPVAVVLAETQEQADYAASLIRVDYTPEDASTDFEKAAQGPTKPGAFMGQPLQSEKGDANAALAAATIRVEATYRTPRYNHNPIESHAVTVAWENDTLRVHDASQLVSHAAWSLSAIFGLRPDQVVVTSPFVGGGFGSKCFWRHHILAAAVARMFGRPVRMALSREDVYRIIGGRSITEQRVTLGADRDGTLKALVHHGVSAKTPFNIMPEPFIFQSRSLYAADAISLDVQTVEIDMVSNCDMRAPGESVGTFAIESAMDELAHEIGLDPVELRIRNQPDVDPLSGLPISQRDVARAYRDGAERFGWSRRDPNPGARREGEWLVGMGCATATYPYNRMPSGAARVTVSSGGHATVEIAAHEMGMGTATVQTQVCADRLGLPVEAVTFRYGDSSLPGVVLAGGSQQTASIGASVIAAHRALVAELLKMAGNDSPLAGLQPEEVGGRDGGLCKLDDPERHESYASILARAGRDVVSAEASPPDPLEMMHWSIHSHGAMFCEVRVNAITGETRVTRFLGSFDCGRILNAKTAASQFRGGTIMGLGMALMEATEFDPRNGRIMNPSLAEYQVPVHMDVPEIEVMWTDIPDPHTPMGARGIGEIGITGVAAAVANAVFNATGKRVRDLPITLDKLL